MIPPLAEIRLKSISRWFKDNDPEKAKLPPLLLKRHALAMDDQMMEAFESREDVLKEQMMRNKTWGTAEGLRQFPMDRLTLWQEITEQFLPTTVPQSED